MDDEQCPKCSSVFPASGAWANRDTLKWPFYQTLAELDTRVRCPRCGHVFQADSYRFFGFVSPRAMRAFVALSLAAAICFVVYFGFIDGPT